jgi:hypothetical protein
LRNIPHILLVTFNPHAAPSLKQQVVGVAFHTRTNAELDNLSVGYANSIENLLDISILVILGIYLKAVTLKVYGVVQPSLLLHVGVVTVD